MKVWLIQPSQFKDQVSLLYGPIGQIEQPPMGLAMIAAVLLAAGFDTDLIDVDAERLTDEQVLARLAPDPPRLVGLSVVTPVFKNAVRLAQKIKTQYPDALVVLGGYHASLEPEASLGPACVDFVVKGEGERTIVDLAEAVAEGPTPARLRAISGLYYKDGGEIVANPKRELIRDLDSLPWPARQLFKTYRYSYPDTKYEPAFPIYTSRGCPGECTFCQQQWITERKLRCRSAKNVADEMEHLISRYGARELHVWDDMFTINRKRVLELRDEIVRRELKVALAFTAGIRVDTASRDVLQAMREMGGYAVAFGIESGSQEILDRTKKRITLDRVRRAVRNAKEVGFETWGFFMLGLLGETLATVEKTIRFAIELDLDVAKFHVAKPYPGSELYYQMKELGLIIDYDVEKYGIHSYPVHRTEQMSQEQIYRAQTDAYRRFYFRRRMILRHARRLNSWTRVRNNVGIAWGIYRLAFRRRARDDPGGPRQVPEGSPPECRRQPV